MMLIGAPPHEEAKYDGDHSMFFQYRFFRSGRSFRNIRLDTPFKLLTNTDTDNLGGYSTNRCTWLSSPSISTRLDSRFAHTPAKRRRNRSTASPSNTLRRYFATKTKWTCILKTQCLPCLISLSSVIDRSIIHL
jgi:hypothetical protein